jgi:hypothetical protein
MTCPELYAQLTLFMAQRAAAEAIRIAAEAIVASKDLEIGGVLDQMDTQGCFSMMTREEQKKITEAKQLTNKK